MARRLWGKTFHALEEIESSFPLASHFRKILKAMQSQNKEEMCLSKAEDICELLYDLDYELAECRIFMQRRKSLRRARIPRNPLIKLLFENKKKNRLVEIKEKFEKLSNKELISSPFRNPSLTHGTSDKAEIFGFKETVENIEKMLFIKVRIIGIYSKAGTEKSELARSVFDSKKASNLFPRKFWLCLSEIKNGKDIRSKIQELDLNERYLVVLDDVGPCHAGFFTDEPLSERLGSNTVVIITTRLLEVAQRMRCQKIFHLQPTKEDCSEYTLTSGIDHGSQSLQGEICGGYQTIGICGMGGAGKTTLAREVFNSKEVRNVYSRMIWVCLSRVQRNEKDIKAKVSKLVLDELDYEINEPIVDNTTTEFLETVEHLLSGERFLIVFDDVWPWHADFLAAEIHSGMRLHEGNGGAVIVTSRLPEVARRLAGENLIRLTGVARRFAGENLIQLEPSLLEKDSSNIFMDTLKSGLRDETKIGSQEGFQRIEKMLSEDGFEIIGICGIAGAGKTKLARDVLSSEKVSKVFPRKIWICLSGILENEQHIREKIVKLALEGLDFGCNESMQDDFGIELFEILGLLFAGERYLIVFDDVRSWHAQFLSEEINSAKGSCRGSGGAVIITSRLLPGLAERFGGINLIDLQHHNKDDYEYIVKQSLRYDQETWDRIKDETKYKCSGLPLAARALGEIFLDKIKESDDFS